MKEIKEWLNTLNDNGLLCLDYENRIKEAVCKEDLFQIICDPNGVTFIPILKRDGVNVPLDMLKNKFKNFINGKVKPIYGSRDIKYKSCLYLDCKDESITIDTTLASIIQYKGEVVIPKNTYPTVYMDCDSEIIFVLEKDAHLRLYVYGNGKYSIVGDQSKVKINRK